MMNCKNAKNNFISFLQNELTEEIRVEMENHFKACSNCSRLLEEFSQLWGVLEHRERIQPSPFFWTRLSQKLIEDEEGKKSALGWLERLAGQARPAIAIGVLVICIFLGYSLGNFAQPVNGQTTSPTDQRAVVLQEFFDSHYLNPLNDLPAGSIEATYQEMISEE
jgi:hypothetical protein